MQRRKLLAIGLLRGCGHKSWLLIARLCPPQVAPVTPWGQEGQRQLWAVPQSRGAEERPPGAGPGTDAGSGSAA